MQFRLVVAAGLLLLAACKRPQPEDAEKAREGMRERAEAQPDTITDLIQARVPQAAAGDTGWAYQQRVTVDLDHDRKDETVVVIADVTLDARGRPLWEDGHRWQVYVEDEGKITRLYARYLPNGKLTAELGASVNGSLPSIVLVQQTPAHLGVYELRYLGPGRTEVFKRLDRTLDAAHAFQGSPRP